MTDLARDEGGVEGDWGVSPRGVRFRGSARGTWVGKDGYEVDLLASAGSHHKK